MGELERLEELADEIATHRRAVDELYGEMVRLIRRVSRKGASRRAVARAAGMSPGRVQQILDGTSLAARYRPGERS